MDIFKKLSRGCNGKLGSLFGITISCILAIVSIFHFILFNTEIDVLQHRLDGAHKQAQDSRWRVIKTIIKDTNQIAKATSNDVADRIQYQTLKAYPDLSVLRKELQSDSPTSNGDAFNRILVSNTKHKFLLDMNGYDNSISVLSRKRVLVDLYQSKHMDLGHSLLVDKEIYGANPELYDEAIEALFSNATNKIIFYEPHESLNKEHIMIQSMTLSALQSVFMKEGLDGLRTYVFLSPTYITDDGDIFGTPDHDKQGFTNNHKIIVVQKFNIVDVIEKLHPNLMTNIDKEEETNVRNIENEMRFKAVTYLAIACVNVFTLMCMIFFLSYLYRKPRRIKKVVEKATNDDH